MIYATLVTTHSGFPDLTRGSWPEVLAIIGVVGVALTAIGLLVALYQLKIGVRRKELSYTVLAAEQLINVHEARELGRRLVITINGANVSEVDVRAVVVRFWNSGTEPISDEDFRTTVYLDYGEKANVLTEGTIQLKPDHVDQTEVSRDKPDTETTSRLVVPPMLLNRKQFIVIRTLVTNVGTVAVHGGLKGVQIKEGVLMEETIEEWSTFWTYMWLCTASAFVAIGQFVSHSTFLFLLLCTVPGLLGGMYVTHRLFVKRRFL